MPDEAAEALARIEAGDVPEGAERRLAAIREHGGAFTSDLSSADFALCHQHGLRPLAQVMGSSVYQVGFQSNVGWAGLGMTPGLWGGSLIAELQVLTEAWNEARMRALGRLAREAQLLGADAVLGVDLSVKAVDYGESMSAGLIEYSVIGTAVAHDGERRSGGLPAASEGRVPVLTELTVADYTKLLGGGFQPVGIAAWSAVFYARYGYATAIRAQQSVVASMGQTESFELTELTQAIYAAREEVMGRVGAQARSMEASGVVGVRLSHTIRAGQGDTREQPGATVTLHVIGTAIREGQGAQAPAPRQTLDLMG